MFSMELLKFGGFYEICGELCMYVHWADPKSACVTDGSHRTHLFCFETLAGYFEGYYKLGHWDNTRIKPVENPQDVVLYVNMPFKSLKYINLLKGAT